MRRRSLFALAAVLVACAESDSALGPADSAFSIQDARVEGGNPHFFWLPPIGTPAASDAPAAAGITPEVHICRLDGESCSEEIAAFTMLDGSGSELIRVDGTGTSFIVNWHTGTANLGAGLDPSATYRIRVLAEGTELGHADVRAAKGRDRKGADPSAFVMVQNGQTLPIRFRIEEGAIPDGPVDPGAGIRRRALASGPYHSCALTAEGAAWCWGGGWSGALGNGTFGESAVPVPVAGDHRFVSLAAGAFHTCGIDEAGAAWCWGTNASGVLGTGVSGGSQNTPVAVTGGLTFVQIEAGASYTCGRTAAGALHCWGNGASGALGNGGTASASEPTAVAGDHAFIMFDAGASHVCAIDGAGAAWCWGGNARGQLGTGSVTTVYPYIGSTSPEPVQGGHAFAKLSAGGNHTCALTDAGVAWCWGAAYDGQLGDGTIDPAHTEPVAVLGGHAFRTISAAASHTCAVATDDTAWCWGSNGFGQTGTGTPGAPQRITEPATVLGGFAWRDVHGGDTHTCGVTVGGAGMCWGLSNLGTGSWDGAALPVAIAGGLVLAVN